MTTGLSARPLTIVYYFIFLAIYLFYMYIRVFLSDQGLPIPTWFIMIIMFYSTIDAQIGSCLDHLQLYTHAKGRDERSCQ